jgi:hypothetical protein
MQAAYAPIQLAGWSVAVQAPMDEAYASMYNMRYVLIFSAVAVFVISILLSSFFIRRVSKPISEAAGYKFVAKTHRLAYGMKATFLWVDFNIEQIYYIRIKR